MKHQASASGHVCLWMLPVFPIKTRGKIQGNTLVFLQVVIANPSESSELRCLVWVQWDSSSACSWSVLWLCLHSFVCWEFVNQNGFFKLSDHSWRGVYQMLFVFASSQLFGVLLWCVSWADLFYSFHELLQNRTPPPVYFVTPLVVGITVVRSCFCSPSPVWITFS